MSLGQRIVGNHVGASMERLAGLWDDVLLCVAILAGYAVVVGLVSFVRYAAARPVPAAQPEGQVPPE